MRNNRLKGGNIEMSEKKIIENIPTVRMTRLCKFTRKGKKIEI